MKKIIVSLMSFCLCSALSAAVTLDEVHIPVGQQKINHDICKEACGLLGFRAGVMTRTITLFCKCTDGPKGSVPNVDEAAPPKIKPPARP